MAGFVAFGTIQNAPLWLQIPVSQNYALANLYALVTLGHAAFALRGPPSHGHGVSRLIEPCLATQVCRWSARNT